MEEQLHPDLTLQNVIGDKQIFKKSGNRKEGVELQINFSNVIQYV